jgi:hypothetical protein
MRQNISTVNVAVRRADPFPFITKQEIEGRERSANKAKQKASTPIQMFLPGMDEFMRAMPNLLARSSLCAPIARGHRKMHGGTVLVSRKDSAPLYRDSVPPIPLKPAPTHAFSEANRPLPFFTLFLPAVSVRKLQMGNKSWAPPRGSPTFGGSPSHIKTSRLCGLNHWAGYATDTGTRTAARQAACVPYAPSAPSACRGQRGVASAPFARTIQARKLLNPSTRERQI